jgi:hypothetical protein
MKISLLPLVLALVALTAIFLLPVALVALTGEALFAAGILAIFLGDYGRRRPPFRPAAPLLAFAPAPAPAEFREAA